MAAGDGITIQSSRWKAIRWTFVCFVFVLAGGLIASESGLGNKVAGIGAALLGLFGLFRFAPEVVHRRTLVSVGPDGFEQRLAFPRGRLIAWGNVTDISVKQREHKVKTVCVEVTDLEQLVPGRHPMLDAEHSRWWSPIWKLVIGAGVLVTEGFDSYSDLVDVSKADLVPDGIELPTTGLPIKAEELAEMLRNGAAGAGHELPAHAPASPRP
jgi:hypothetical protein